MVLRPTRELFTHMETSPLPVNARVRHQILTYIGQSWPLISEGSLSNNTYCDMGHPFIMVIFKDPWIICCQAFGSGAVTTCFSDFDLSQPVMELPHARRTLYHCYTYINTTEKEPTTIPACFLFIWIDLNFPTKLHASWYFSPQKLVVLYSLHVYNMC